ncbi:hypothetical protein B0I33_112111 [Prauserella shujinwangii]|uniref:Uncharacterized protein n=1 Tax=Prauserella shujinwangii TaxID=1453103 RepID=A0A2T0LMC0_9PSEU|nr:hypothetical protein B0I33_112111 [Prauserella shujinwangii]
MARMLTNLKFWGLACALTWLVIVTVIITKNPDAALTTH